MLVLLATAEAKNQKEVFILACWHCLALEKSNSVKNFIVKLW